MILGDEIDEGLADGLEIQAAESFEVAPPGENEPAEIAAMLVAKLDEFQHLRVGEPVIVFLMRADPKAKGTKTIIGQMCLPRFMGTLASVATWLLARACGGVPDFLMLIDKSWWRIATLHQRHALIHHELMHADHARDKDGEPKFHDNGDPMWAIREHDIEEFNDTVERFGLWKDDLVNFNAAIKRSGNARGAA
jgi:hypothetical protein